MGENNLISLDEVKKGRWKCGNCNHSGSAAKNVPETCPKCGSRKIWWPNGVMPDPKGKGVIHYAPEEE